MADNHAAVPFARIFADAVQSTYKALHALIDDLVDSDPEARRERIVEFAIEKRHLFVRLLITVRWHMNFSAFHNSARSSFNLANARSSVFVRDADSLHFIWSVLKNATTPAPALHEAAEVLGASLVFDRMPRCIIDSLGLDSHVILHDAKPALLSDTPSKTPAKTPPKTVSAYAEAPDAEDDISQEAAERLGSLTRRIVTESLPTGISVVQYSAPPEGAAVRIGVPGAWTADVILSNLILKDARLHLLQIRILVDSHPDVQSTMRSHVRIDHRPVIMHDESHANLRTMLDDRMGWVMSDALSTGQTEQRFALALRTLATGLSRQCAAFIVIANIRAELSVMIKSIKRWQQAGLSAEGRFHKRKGPSPLRIFYWSKSHVKSSMQITAPGENCDSCGQIVEFEHDPPFPPTEPPLQIVYDRVDAQKIVLDAGRVRARHELCNIQCLCEESFNPSVSSVISASQNAALSLVFSFRGHGPGLELSLSLASGAAFISPKGALQLALSGVTGDLKKKMDLLFWKGERFFKTGGRKALWITCEKILEHGVSLLQQCATMRSMCALGHGAMKEWPPGVPSVEKPVNGSMEQPVQAPFCALDLKRPRCFLSLGSVSGESSGKMIQSERPPAKRRKVQFNFSQSGGMYFFEGQPREDHDASYVVGEMVRSAGAMASWAEVHQDVNIRLKRNKIVKMLAAHKLMPELPPEVSMSVSERVQVEMKTLPLETERSVLVVGDGEGWGVELTLTNGVFNHESFIGYGIAYNAETHVLRFYYPDVSKTTVVQFARDLMRARTAGTLAAFLKDDSKTYDVVLRTPSRMVVNLNGLRLAVGLGTGGVEIETWPRHHVFQAHLVPLMEEVLLESRKKMGHSLAGLLHMAVPMGLALQKALPRDPSMYRLRFLNSLWVRIAVGGRRNGERVTHCIDVDVKRGAKKVYVSDYGKYMRQKAAKGSKEVGTSGQFAEIPKWESFVKQVVERKAGRTVNAQGSTVEIAMSLLGEFLSVVIKVA